MPNIKKYTITEWNNHEVVFAVDHDKATDSLFKEVNEFFVDSDDRLKENNGNACLAVLKMIAEYCFSFQASNELNSWGMMRHFGADDDPNSGVEGFPRLDGSSGILLLRADIPEFEIDKDVKTQELEAMPKSPQPSW